MTTLYRPTNERGFLGATRRKSPVVGRDVHIAVRDNTHMCRYLSVPLTAHSVDMAHVGRCLVEGLIMRIEHPDAPFTQVVVPGKMQQVIGV